MLRRVKATLAALAAAPLTHRGEDFELRMLSEMR